MNVRFDYDRVSDFAFIHLTPGQVADRTFVLDTEDIDAEGWHIAVEFSRTGKVTGIEFGGASKLFEAEFLADQVSQH